MLSECCLWRQHSNNFGCELQTYPRLSTKVFSCKCCVVWVLFECCLWRQHSDNFGRELQTYPRFSTKKKVSWKCCLNVVSGDNIETTLRQHSGKRIVFRLFLARNKCFRPLKKVKNTYFVRMLSLETTLRQHWDNIRAKEVFFAFFWLEISVFGLWKRSKTLILSECCLWRQHSDNIH